MHIIIVDDEKAISKGICSLIISMQKPYLESVNWFYNVDDVYKQLNENKVDVIITDIQMPDQSGLSLIDDIKLKYPSIKFIVVSGYDLFEYVDSAYKKGVTDYIRKPISKQQLSERLDIIQESLVETQNINEFARRKKDAKVIEDIYSINTNDVDDYIKDNINIFDEIVTAGIHFVISATGVEYKNLEGVDKFLLSETGVKFNLCVTPDSNGNIIFLFTVENERDSSIIKSSFQKMAYIKFGNSFFGGISDNSDSYEGIVLLYHQALKALQYKIVNKPNVFVYYKDIENREDFYPEIAKIGVKIEKLIVMSELKDFKMFLDHLFSPENLQNYSVFAIEQLYNTVLNTLASFSQDDSDEKNVIYTLEQHQSVNEIIAYFQKQATTIFNNKNDDIYDGLKKNAAKYIEEHYMENLTLAMVSNHLSISYNYFSKLFRDLFGMNFSAYLSKIRMERANELIAHSGLSILEIANKVGYASPKHFSRAYKNYYGYSPRKFSKDSN